MCRTRQFTNDEIASFMEMQTMGIRNKAIAREYGADHTQIYRAMDYARRNGMAREAMPELASQGPRFVQRGRSA